MARARKLTEDQEQQLAIMRSNVNELLAQDDKGLILSFVDSLIQKKCNINNIATYYPEFKILCSEANLPIPTYSNYLLTYHLTKRSGVVEFYRVETERFNRGLNKWQRKLLKAQEEGLEDTKEIDTQIKFYERNMNNFNKCYLESSRDLLKYADAGVNRETVKKVDVTTTHKIQLADLHKVMRDGADLVDIDAEVLR